jgi:hypothetical protein
LDKIYQRKRIGNNGFFHAWYYSSSSRERDFYPF